MAETTFHTTFLISQFLLSRAKNGSESGLRSAVSYRFGFNGQEMDNEITGLTGTHTTAMFWEYDSRLGRRWNLDPKPTVGVSDYACFGDNPVFSVDILGDTVTVTTRAGKYLFKLDWGGTNNFTVTAQTLYAFGVQWWEPQADYYVPLLDVADNIEVMDELKHFEWSDLVNYGLVDRNSWDYRQQGSGDWKWKSDGADEFLLTEIGGIPYWSDALGQIPFTIDTYLDCREDDGLNNQEAAAKTVRLGQDHAGGQLYGGSSEVNSSYDNLMILRVILQAGKISRGKSSDYKDLGNPVSQQDAGEFGYTHPIAAPSFEQVKQFFGQ